MLSTWSCQLNSCNVRRWQGSARTWRKLGSQHPEEAFSDIYFFSFSPKWKSSQNWRGEFVYWRGRGRGGSETKKLPNQLTYERPAQKQCYILYMTMGVLYFFSLLFVSSTSIYCILLVQGVLFLVLPGWGQSYKAARVSWLFVKINIDIKVGLTSK